MPSNSKFTKDENGNVAIRVVSNDTSVSNSESMFTHDEGGNVAVRVVYGEGSGGGGDSHNKGYYETAQALAEAHPTGEAGDYAIVGATDTVWIWDTTTASWKDSDTKGEVTSVNGQTGTVVLDSEDVLPSQTGHSGHVLGTDGFVAGWIVPEQVQRSTMPQADENEVGNIYQFTGTTDANYTNGYFYKCVSDGQEPATYSWTRVDVQPTPNPLPSQTGQSGKFLTTDGTDASWSDKPLVNVATGANSITIGGTAATQQDIINIGRSSTAFRNSVAIGANTNGGAYSVAIGDNAQVLQGSLGYCVAIGYNARTPFGVKYAIQLGYNATNSDANTLKVANANGNFEIMSADGTVPHGRLTNAVVSNTITIAVADWNGGTTCTKTISGLTATSTVWVAPAGTSMSDYTGAGIYASAQATDQITFTATTTPTSAIDVVVTYC